MIRAIVLIGGGVICLASCAGDVRYGLTRTDLASAAAESSIVEAIQHTLEPSQAKCSTRLLERGTPPSDGSNGSKERVIADVCGNHQRYEVSWIRVSENQVMLTAKRI